MYNAAVLQCCGIRFDRIEFMGRPMKLGRPGKIAHQTVFTPGIDVRENNFDFFSEFLGVFFMNQIRIAEFRIHEQTQLLQDFRYAI